MIANAMLTKYTNQIIRQSSFPTIFPAHVPSASNNGIATAVTTVQIRPHLKMTGQFWLLK